MHGFRKHRGRRRFFALLLPLELACSPSPQDPGAGKPPRLHSGPNPYHDLTEFNYVTLWASNFAPAEAEERICILNGQLDSCAKFQRGSRTSWLPAPGATTEFLLPALPFGENRFEIRRADGYPLAATEFVVCRRVMEVDMHVGADGKAETTDDQVERVHTLAWKDGLADWEAFNEWANPASNETRIHSFAYRVTDTVSVYDAQGQLVKREIRRYSPQGLPITSDTYAPTGELIAYRKPCMPSSTEFGWTPDPSGACQFVAPAVAVSYSHPGTDVTWHTADNFVDEVTEYYYLLGETWYRGAPPDGQWLRTRFLAPTTQATFQSMHGWFSTASGSDELHEPDLARPGLWVKTLRNRRVAGESMGLVGFRMYEYQCAP